MTRIVGFSPKSVQTAKDLLESEIFQPTVVAVLKRRNAGGLTIAVTKSGGPTASVKFTADRLADLNRVVNESPRGVLDPGFIGEISVNVIAAFDKIEEF